MALPVVAAAKSLPAVGKGAPVRTRMALFMFPGRMVSRRALEGCSIKPTEDRTRASCVYHTRVHHRRSRPQIVCNYVRQAAVATVGVLRAL